MGSGGRQSPEKFSGGMRRIPDFTRDVAAKYVGRGLSLLFEHFLTLLLVPLGGFCLLAIAHKAIDIYKAGHIQQLWSEARQTDLQLNLASLLVCCVVLIVVLATWVFWQSRPVYLLDYHVHKPEDSLKISSKIFLERSTSSGNFSEESLTFQSKLLKSSGLGDATYLPAGLHKSPNDMSMASAREEAEIVMFDSVQRVLQRCGLQPKQVDILIVNCSLFNPTPSLSAMIVNHFKMKSNIVSYNLSGMGCSAGVISLSLARELLQVYPNSRVLVVSTENITQNWYCGSQRSMLVPNCLFRVGAAAVLLSNRWKDSWHAKYELAHVVRTHMGASDQSYNCVFQCEDPDGRVGVALSKQVMAIAGHALKANITTLAPLVLPWSEQAKFLLNLFVRKVMRMRHLQAYVPNFKRAFEHFAIHTGGRAVVDEIEKQLSLTPYLTQPSRDTLERYGNTSSSSIWYVLACIETKRGLRKGDRVWQIAFGSGFKCNSAVWRARRHIKTQHEAWIEQDQEWKL